MNQLTDQKLITCLIPKGRGSEAVAALKEEMSIDCANVSSGRSDLFQHSNKEIESEIVTAVVSEAQADEVFSFLYEKLEIDQPHHGILFQNSLLSTTAFTLSASE